ncbi:hypothetical protein BD410DRAFT_896821 [Rickenella mellea]|uniref:Uncharacterized protein n=1 Tax=Rickenella mellea TaxID=50990 RepID=A0A4Y7QAM6_9AGAM|nr:hypothetical protein BD410DRAFT_896821 [Rickenella mellea]
MTSVHPINRLPPELLAELFIHCLSTTGFSRARTFDAPMNVSSVCSSWHEIAISTPQLWSSIYRGHFDRDPHFAAILEQWVPRSGSYGFSFSIQKLYHQNWEGTMDLKAALHVLAKYSERWVVMDVLTEPWSFSILTSVIPHKTPALRRIRISNYDTDHPCHFDLFNTSTPLNHLTHLSITAHMSFPTGRPLPNLRNLCMYTVDTVDIMGCLSQCPGIEELVIRFDDWSYQSVPVVDIYLPHLRTFKMILDSNADEELDVNVVQLLENLRVPCLKTFFINIEREPGDGPIWTGLQSFLRRLNNTVESLEMWTCMSTLLEFENCLELLPGLKYLAFPYALIEDEVAPELFSRSRSSALCPQLNTLGIVKRHPYAINPLLSALHSRLVETADAVGQASDPPGDFTVVVWEDAAQFVRQYADLFPRINFQDSEDWISRRRHDLYTDVGEHVWDIC